MKYILGSRGSALALAQVELFSNAFLAAHSEDELELLVVKTTGDKKQETPEAAISDKREWIHELELGVAEGTLDIALHSGKDVPCDIHEETVLVPVLSRENPNDLFIGKFCSDRGRRVLFSELEEGAVVGTASLRRQAQVKRLRGDLRLIDVRGNVQTRVKKLDDGNMELGGIILAAAGVHRMGSELVVKGEVFSADQMLPAVNQGMLCVQVRRDRLALIDQLGTLAPERDTACFFAERAVAKILEGDCHSAVSIFASAVEQNNEVSLRAEVYDQSSLRTLRASGSGVLQEAEEIGRRVGEQLLSQGATELLRPE
ncbi:hydroxymethylbilane synthase [bacterium]|nr:hydroxymethylbilane synthase [bacterium]